MENLSVLVVEDESTMREMLKEMLFRVGASKVVDCPDGASAVQAYAQDEFNIVMLDLGLPDYNGHDLMRDIKARKPRQHVVLVTADDSIDSIQKAISAGANGYVVKPYSPEKIQDVVSNYLMIHGVDDSIVRDARGPQY